MKYLSLKKISALTVKKLSMSKLSSLWRIAIFPLRLAAFVMAAIGVI
jgi:hypothetical protein|tara:strand:- start:165 stop:305 length:141 start_codon:yes stop_codon:yes gene_type:complete